MIKKISISSLNKINNKSTGSININKLKKSSACKLHKMSKNTKKVKHNQKIYNFDNKNFWTYLKKPCGFTKTINNGKIKKAPKYKYYLNQQLVIQPKLLDRLHKLYIPPAYTNVIIAKSPNYKIQAIGVDVKGRKQYIYHPNFIKSQLSKKYDDIVCLGDKIINMEKDIKNKLQNICDKGTIIDTPNDLFPIIINMLLKYHFRIGNQKYENDNNSYGITTLCNKHIKFGTGNNFTIEFIGKKGVENRINDNDILMANALRILQRESADNEHLFCYQRDGKNSIITPEQVKTYLNNTYKTHITPKMFRTWYANYHLLSYLKDINKNRPDLIGHKMTKKQINTLVKNSSKYVSDKLNNTPTISKKSYINPLILNKVLVNPSKFISNIPTKKRDIHTYLKSIMSNKVDEL